MMKKYTLTTWEAAVRGFFDGFAQGIEPFVHAKPTEDGGFKIHSRRNDMTVIGTASNNVLKVLTGWNGRRYNHTYAMRIG